MKWSDLKYTIHSTNDHLNTRTLMWIHRHRSILVAAGCVLLMVWGAASQHPVFTFGVAAAGAIGYFAGIFTAFLAGTIAFIVSILETSHGSFSVAFIVLEIIGYVASAWLGESHRRVRMEQKTSQKPNQILPWAVVNEVRTSLSAIRFLLFPGDTNEHDAKNLQRATDELSRLEQLFKELEK